MPWQCRQSLCPRPSVPNQGARRHPWSPGKPRQLALPPVWAGPEPLHTNRFAVMPTPLAGWTRLRATVHSQPQTAGVLWGSGSLERMRPFLTGARPVPPPAFSLSLPTLRDAPSPHLEAWAVDLVPLGRAVPTPTLPGAHSHRLVYHTRSRQGRSAPLTPRRGERGRGGGLRRGKATHGATDRGLFTATGRWLSPGSECMPPRAWTARVPAPFCREQKPGSGQHWPFYPEGPPRAPSQGGLSHCA